MYAMDLVPRPLVTLARTISVDAWVGKPRFNNELQVIEGSLGRDDHLRDCPDGRARRYLVIQWDMKLSQSFFLGWGAPFVLPFFFPSLLFSII